MTESPDEATRDEQSEEDAPVKDEPSETSGSQDVGPGGAPGEGGYRGRDPKTDMPRLPSRPDAEDDE